MSAASTSKPYCALFSKSGEFLISRLPRENSHTYLNIITYGRRAREGRGRELARATCDADEIERFHSGGQYTGKFIGTKESVWYTNMVTVSLSWSINMVAVTSRRDDMRKRSMNARVLRVRKGIRIFIKEINERFSFLFLAVFSNQNERFVGPRENKFARQNYPLTANLPEKQDLILPYVYLCHRFRKHLQCCL